MLSRWYGVSSVCLAETCWFHYDTAHCLLLRPERRLQLPSLRLIAICQVGSCDCCSGLRKDLLLASLGSSADCNRHNCPRLVGHNYTWAPRCASYPLLTIDTSVLRTIASTAASSQPRHWTMLLMAACAASRRFLLCRDNRHKTWSTFAAIQQRTMSTFISTAFHRRKSD